MIADKQLCCGKMSVVNVKVANIRKEGYRDLQTWMSNENNIYIGRAGIVFIDKQRFPKEASPWANPFKVGEGKGKHTREEAVKLYEGFVRDRIKDPKWKEELLKLKGKNLGCWCSPEPCHGDVLMKIIEELV